MRSDTDTDSIWVAPTARALEIMPQVLGAPDLAAIWTATLRFRTDYADWIAAQLDRDLDEMGPEPDDIDMNDRLRRDMRANALDLAVESWAGLTALAGRRSAAAEEGQPLCFGMPLIETHPPADLDLTDADIFAETSRLHDEIGALISEDRGRGPCRVILPDAATDFAADDDDWTDAQILLVEIGRLTAYWPPAKGRPALALTQCQDSGAEPVQMLIYAHDDAGHEVFLRILQDAGGKLA